MAGQLLNNVLVCSSTYAKASVGRPNIQLGF